MSVLIRQARAADAAAMVLLLNPIIRHGGLTVMQHELSPADQLGFIRMFPPRGVFHVASNSDESQLCGLQDVQPVSEHDAAQRHVGAISTFVAMDSQRRGVGRALTESTLSVAAERGYEKLIAWIRADNARAIAFYRAMGFEQVGIARSHLRVAEQGLDAVLMERLILGA